MGAVRHFIGLGEKKRKMLNNTTEYGQEGRRQVDMGSARRRSMMSLKSYCFRFVPLCCLKRDRDAEIGRYINNLWPNVQRGEIKCFFCRLLSWQMGKEEEEIGGERANTIFFGVDGTMLSR